MRTDRLRSLRERMGLNQGEAAKKMGIVRTTYSNYEAGNREPDNETLIKMAKFFDVSVDYLLGIDKPIINDQAKNDVLEKYSRLPQDEKKLIDDMIRKLADKRRQ